MKINYNYCSHRGFNTIAPENSIPSFATAVSLGAEEIEFDLWATLDGHLLVCHDETINRTSSGQGLISSLTKNELMKVDAGAYFSPYYKGLKFPFFEDVLELFANKVRMNIHIKSAHDNSSSIPEMFARYQQLSRYYQEDVIANLDEDLQTEHVILEMENRQIKAYDPFVFERIITLIQQYHCEETVYITGEKDVLETALHLAPEISRCCLEGHMNYSIVENALKYQCERVQFCKHFTTKKMISYAKEVGLITNLFWSNNYEESRHFIENGIDMVLTDNYLNTVFG